MKSCEKAVCAVAVCCMLLSGCTTSSPTIYTGLASASELRPNTRDRNGRVPYAYQPPVDWTAYNRVIMDPVAIYAGQDAQFAKVTESEKSELANHMRNEFRARLNKRFAIVETPGPSTIRLKLTLTGAQLTTSGLGTLSHVDIAGGVYNVVQATRGREGSMTGSVSFAVEIYDAQTNRLLRAYVSKQYPGAMNIGATVGALKASFVGIDKGADELANSLR